MFVLHASTSPPWWPVVLASFPLLLSGCVQDGADCSLIGCSDGISLQFVDEAGGVLTRYSGVAEFADGQVAFECQEGSGGSSEFTCLTGGWVMLYRTDSRFSVGAIASGASLAYAGEVDAVYDEVFPNGPSCEPMCLQGELVLIMTQPPT